MNLGSGLYSGILENIKESKYLRCYKYPNNCKRTYELMVHHSGRRSSYRGIHYQVNYHIGGRGS